MKALYPLNKQVQLALKDLLSEVKACNIYYGNRMELALARHIASEINHALREWYGSVLNTLDTILRLKGKVNSTTAAEGGAERGSSLSATIAEGGLEILPGVKLPTLNFSKLIDSVKDNASRRMLIMILRNGPPPGGGGGGGDPGNKPSPSKVPSNKSNSDQPRRPGAGGGGGAGGKGASGGGAIMQLFKDPSNRNYCFDWLNGRCSADPCRFVHDDSMTDQAKGFLKRAHKLLQTPK